MKLNNINKRNINENVPQSNYPNQVNQNNSLNMYAQDNIVKLINIKKMNLIIIIYYIPKKIFKIIIYQKKMINLVKKIIQDIMNI